MFSYDIKILDDNTISDWIRGKGMSSLDYLLKVLVAIIVFYLIAKVLRVIAVTIQKRQLHIVDAASIAALVASAGVGISLAMQGALSNLAGGVLLLIIRPFKKGDYIEIPNANVEGVVEEIAIYYTTIQTVAGEVIKIPNAQLTNNSVKNRSGNAIRALVINVDVDYDTEIDKARELVLGLIKEERKVSSKEVRISSLMS